MSLHLHPPFRAEHCGSLKRPLTLLEKRKDFDDKKCSREDLRVVEDATIKDIIRMQKEVGIKSITDGEFRRYESRNMGHITGVHITFTQAHVL